MLPLMLPEGPWKTCLGRSWCTQRRPGCRSTCRPGTIGRALLGEKISPPGNPGTCLHSWPLQPHCPQMTFQGGKYHNTLRPGNQSTCLRGSTNKKLRRLKKSTCLLYMGSRQWLNYNLRYRTSYLGCTVQQCKPRILSRQCTCQMRKNIYLVDRECKLRPSNHLYNSHSYILCKVRCFPGCTSPIGTGRNRCTQQEGVPILVSRYPLRIEYGKVVKALDID